MNTMNMPSFQLLRAVTFSLLRAGAVPGFVWHVICAKITAAQLSNVYVTANQFCVHGVRFNSACCA